MENTIVILAVIAAVWYLFRKWRATVNSDNPGCDGSCGCSGPPKTGPDSPFPIDNGNHQTSKGEQ